jgi:hypothetical protein
VNQTILAGSIFSSIAVVIYLLGPLISALGISAGFQVLIAIGSIFGLIFLHLLVLGRMSNRFLRNVARHRLRDLRRRFPELVAGHWLVTVEREKVVVMTTAGKPREFALSQLDIRTTVGPNRRFNNGLALRHSSGFIVYIPRWAECEEPLPEVKSLIEKRLGT